MYVCVRVATVKTTDVENSEPDYVRDVDGVMKFRCGVCEMLFARIWHLRRHIKLHYGYKPHACPVCPKTFARAEHLRKHMHRHASGRTFRPHVCRHCLAEFSVGRELKDHIRSQHTAASNSLNGAAKRHKHQVLTAICQWHCVATRLSCNPGQVVSTHVPLSPSSIIWYQLMGGDAMWLGR